MKIKMRFLVKEALEKQMLIGMLAHAYMKREFSMKDAIEKAKLFHETHEYETEDNSECQEIINEFGKLHIDFENIEFNID